MNGRIERSFTAARTVLHEDQGLARIVIVGSVCGGTGVQILRSCEEDLPRLDAFGLVADYSQAEMRVDACRLWRAASSVMRGRTALKMPTALLVHPDHMPLWRVYCDLQCKSGIMRRAFTSSALAEQWLQDQAALWAAQARCRALARSTR